MQRRPELVEGCTRTRQDKGHAAEVRTFVERVASGGEFLIPWPVLEEVTLATFVAVERASEQPRAVSPLGKSGRQDKVR